MTTVQKHKKNVVAIHELPLHFLCCTQLKTAIIATTFFVLHSTENRYIFVTVDRNLSFQQNLPQFDIAVMVLQTPSNSLTALKPLASKLLAVLDSANKSQVTSVAV